jgi:hypothetical protein
VRGRGVLVRQSQFFQSCIQSVPDKADCILEGYKGVFPKYAVNPFVVVESSDLNGAPESVG